MDAFRYISPLTGGLPRQCAHWLAMTASIRQTPIYLSEGKSGILPGDKVVVRPQSTADDGQIVVARLEDEATVKRLRRRNGEIWLLPENDAYAPIDGTHAEIIGVVKGVVREY